MNWQFSFGVYRCPVCGASILLEQGEELPGYCKQCETEMEDEE